jgi:hypothetical protein
MTITTTIRLAAAGLVAAATLSPVALAGGEPKNDWPFNRSVTERTPAQVQRSDAQAVVPAGEPKNQWPFTRRVGGGVAYQTVSSAGASRVGYGEAKNDQPFNQPVVSPTPLVRSSGGFDWGDAAIGLAAGIGLALMLAGLLVAMRRSPRVRKIGAPAAG